MDAEGCICTCEGVRIAGMDIHSGKVAGPENLVE